MPGVGEAAGEAAEQGTNNMKEGLGGGLAIGLSTALAGDSIGPFLGGIAGGFALDKWGGDEVDSDNVTQFGMMLGMANAFSGGGGSTRQRQGVK